MRIVVCGAGRVGTGIARRLSREQNDVTVIDQSKKLIRSVAERLDVRGITVPRIEQARVGGNARVIGAASSPILQQFF